MSRLDTSPPSRGRFGRTSLQGLHQRPARLLASAILAWLASAFVPFAATAQDDDEDYARIGPYISVGGGVGTFPLVADQAEASSPFDNLSQKESPVVDGRIGYRATEHFAWELQAQYLFEGELEKGNSRIADISGMAVTVNIKGYPWTGAFQPYLTLGFGVLSVESVVNSRPSIQEQDTGPAFRGGLGMEYYFTSWIGIDVGATWLHAQGDTRHFDTVSGTTNLILRF